jgi:hypothetical protein
MLPHAAGGATDVSDADAPSRPDRPELPAALDISDDDALTRPDRPSSFDTGKHFPKSQALDLLSVSNPQPTTVPAPQRQYFGTLGARHVICMVGLPYRGRNYVASELGWYLEFFHGAEVRHFDVAASAAASGGSGREEHAQALLAEIQSFLQSSSASTALNLDEQSTADEKKTRQTDAGKVAIILPFTMLSEPPRDAASTHGDAPAHPPSLQPQASPSLARDQWLIERSRDSWTHIWSCTNVMDREWVRSKLHAAAGGDCKLMFIELVVSDQRLVQEQISSLQPASRPVFKELHALHARAYTPLSRSASPEARLSYLRLLNFRDIETHRMHGFLRMRIAQFLSVLRPSRHTVYLSRHGESTYNVEKKAWPPTEPATFASALALMVSRVRCMLTQLGGNPGLSPMGEQYPAPSPAPAPAPSPARAPAPSPAPSPAPRTLARTAHPRPHPGRLPLGEQCVASPAHPDPTLSTGRGLSVAGTRSASGSTQHTPSSASPPRTRWCVRGCGRRRCCAPTRRPRTYRTRTCEHAMGSWAPPQTPRETPSRPTTTMLHGSRCRIASTASWTRSSRANMTVSPRRR